MIHNNTIYFFDPDIKPKNTEYIVIREIDENFIMIRCNTCGLSFPYSKINVHKFKHSSYGHCAQTLYKVIDEKYGKEFKDKLFRTMRGAKNRVTNPNNKDYENYKDYEFGFNDSWEFAEHCIPLLQDAIEKFNINDLSKLSIDRINGNLGYIPGNIRFIPMKYNLKNKSCIRKVKATDLSTGEITIYENSHVCGEILGINYNRIYDCCKRSNHVYKNKYIFEFEEV